MRRSGRCDTARVHAGDREATAWFGAHGCTHRGQHPGQSTAAGRAYEDIVPDLLGQFAYHNHATMLARAGFAHIGAESEILNQTVLRYSVGRDDSGRDRGHPSWIGSRELAPAWPSRLFATVLRSQTRDPHRQHRQRFLRSVRNRCQPPQLPTCRYSQDRQQATAPVSPRPNHAVSCSVVGVVGRRSRPFGGRSYGNGGVLRRDVPRRAGLLSG